MMLHHRRAAPAVHQQQGQQLHAAEADEDLHLALKVKHTPRAGDPHPLAPVQPPSPSQPAQAPTHKRSWKPSALFFAFCYLLTGTALAVIGQKVVLQGAAAPVAQLPAFTKYISSFVLTLGLHGASSLFSGGKHKAGPKAGTVLTWAIGFMDTVAYALNCLGFARCGSALSMVVFAASGQVCTMLTRLFILRRASTRTQYIAVAIVCLGLMIRASGTTFTLQPSTTPTPAFSQQSSMGSLDASDDPYGSEYADNGDASTIERGSSASSAGSGAGGGGGGMVISGAVALTPEALVGAAFIALSGLCYSLVGVFYEWLVQVSGPGMSHVKVNTWTSAIGLAAMSAYMVLYTYPNREELVLQRMRERDISLMQVVRLYALFGGLFTAHSLVQAKVLELAGASAVGIVSALRAATVTLASGWLFCSPAAPQQCLTPPSFWGAMVVTCGALLWGLGSERKGKSVPASIKGDGAVLHVRPSMDIKAKEQ